MPELPTYKTRENGKEKSVLLLQIHGQSRHHIDHIAAGFGLNPVHTQWGAQIYFDLFENSRAVDVADVFSKHGYDTEFAGFSSPKFLSEREYNMALRARRQQPAS